LTGRSAGGKAVAAMRTLLASSLLASSLLAACSAPIAQVAATNPSPRPLQPRAATDVQVFVSRRPVEAHVDVAIIRPAQVGAYGATLSEVVDAVRIEAAQLGCDGVVLDARDQIWGSCIVFAGAPAVAAPAVAAPAVAAPVAVAEGVATSTPVAAAPSAPVAVAPPPSRPASPPSVVLERVFAKLDRDHNGRLGPEELPKNASSLVHQIDTNGDGWVTRYELRTFNAALRTR